MAQNEFETSNNHAQPKSGSAESATLYEKLVKFGKDCDEGNYPSHSFETGIHEFLSDELDADGKSFLAKILPFLVKLHYVEETATIDDVLALLKRHDSWADLDCFDDFFSDAIEKMQNLKPTSRLGEESRDSFLKILENTRDAVNKSLDFPIPMPGGIDETRNPNFHVLVLDLAKLAFENSKIFQEWHGR